MIMMRNLLAGVCLLLLAGTVHIGAQSPDWSGAERIVNSIEKTSFPERIFNIEDYGARKGVAILSTEAINKAIIACNQEGGGKVIVPKGEFLTGPIKLKSNVNLYLEEGARSWRRSNR